MENKERKINILKIKSKQLTTREKLTPFGVFFIIIFTIIIFAVPLVKKIGETRGKINEEKQIYDNLTLKKNKLQSFQEGVSLTNLDEQFKYIESYLPSYKPSLPTLLNLMRLSRLEGVQFSGLSLNPGKIENTTQEANPNNPDSNSQVVEESTQNDAVNFEINFSLEGEKKNIFNFITRLKDISPLMKINHFSINMASQNQADTNISVNLKVLVYYMSGPRILLPIEGQLENLTQDEELFLNKLIDSISVNSDDENINIAPGEKMGKDNPFIKPTQPEVPPAQD